MMTQAKVKFASFEEYLRWSNDPDHDREGLVEWVNGELVDVPPESGLNRAIANRLFFLLVSMGIVPLELVYPGQCEVQVPIVQPNDPANRYPDLVILDPVHVPLTQTRLTITLDMPPPQLVAEVLSPGAQNRYRDLVCKRSQYAARCIPEYWLIDPEDRSITILQWVDGEYRQVGCWRSRQSIDSPCFPTLQLVVDQVFDS